MNIWGEFLITIVLTIVAAYATYIFGSRYRIQADALDRIVSRWANSVFLTLVAGYTLVFSWLAILRYLAINTGYDLAQYDQIIWNSLQGRLFWQTYVTDAPMFLGKSFTPILLAFVPLYAVWSNPIVLLCVQTIALAVAAFPLYWLARARLGKPLALVVVLAFLLYPALIGVNVVDFHEIALATPALAFATFFLLREHHKGFLVCLTIALLIKEEIAFIAAAFGIYILFVQRKRWFGATLIIFGIGWLVLLLQYVIPFLHGAGAGGAFYYLGGSAYQRYAYLGKGLADVLITLFTRPDIILQHVVIPAKIEFVLHLFVPLAFLPFIGIEVLGLAVPTFGYSLLSDYRPQFSIRYPYTPPLFPFLFFALVIGLQRIIARKSFNSFIGKLSLAFALLTASIVSYVLHSAGPFARIFDPATYTLQPRDLIGQQLVTTIPRDAVVVAQSEWMGRLSQREYVYNVEDPTNFHRADHVFADQTRVWYDLRRVTWEEWLSNGYFEIVNQVDGFVVARRKDPETKLQIRFDGGLHLIGATILPDDTLRGGTILRANLLWRADQPLPDQYAIVAQVVDTHGHIWATDRRELHPGQPPLAFWETGKPIGDQLTLRLPPTMPTGNYQLTVSVQAKSSLEFLNAHNTRGESLGVETTVASLKIDKNKEPFTASDLAIEQLLLADLREMRLLGYVPPRETIAPGELLQLGLYWRARSKPQGDYVVAVQFRNSHGQVAFEHTDRPAKGTYPTTEWSAGEVLLDWHDFSLPKNIAPGIYEIWIALHHSATHAPLGEIRIVSLKVF
jgi:uncharacterized membrane protein